MDQYFRMIGGDEETSYAKNSRLQRLIQEKVKPILDESLGQFVGDMKSFQDGMIVGDLGCSSGSNAFFTAQNIIECIEKHYQIMNVNHVEELPIIRYIMNDLVSNDFNILFKGLPEFYKIMEKKNGRKNGGCMVAAVAGSFYGKLFPDNFMHFLHSSYGLHWLSQAPKGLVTETDNSNKRNIHCAKRSPPAVKRLYADQFRRDFIMFLRMRYEELVQQGQLLLTFLCENSEEDDDHNYLHLMASALSDMVTESCIEEGNLEGFNLPIYFASVDELRKIIEDEGSFKILKLHSFKTHVDAGYEFNVLEDDNDSVRCRATYVATYLRAVFEPILTSHFKGAIMDDLFCRYANKIMDAQNNGQVQYNTVVISLKKDDYLDRKT